MPNRRVSPRKPGRTQSCWAVAVALIALVSCGKDAITPEQAEGMYDLAQANGTPLPLLLKSSLECDTWLNGGALDLEAPAQADLAVSTKTDCTRAGGSVQNGHDDYMGSWELSGSTLTLTLQHFASSLTLTGTVAPDHVSVVFPDLAASGAVTLELRRRM